MPGPFAVVVLAVAAVAASVLVSGCASEGPPEGGPGAAPTALGHVHGLGVNPADGAVYAATHYGVFRLGQDGSAVRIEDRWQDTMGFTVVGPDQFLGSGHPDQREDLPVHLGLIESKDAARTWQAVSLEGQADFHSLEAVGRRVYGFDSVSGRLLVSDDRGATWRKVAEDPLVDLAVSATDDNLLVATTPAGELLEYRLEAGSGDAERALVPGAPPLVFVDWPQPDRLVGLAPDGQVYVRESDAGGWQGIAGPPGDPQALEATADTWLVATSAGIFRSVDGGRTWMDLAKPDSGSPRSR